MNVFRVKLTLEVGTEAFMGAKCITSKIQDVKIFNMETLRDSQLYEKDISMLSMLFIL